MGKQKESTKTSIDPKFRAEAIRRGNEAFNKGDILKAGQLFKAVAYKDGLIRVADSYFFDKHQPLMAYGYYAAAGKTDMISRITDGFAFALKIWLNDGELPPQEKESIDNLPSAGIDLMRFPLNKK